MSNFFKVNIGDWSNDGHGRNEVFVIDSTKSNEEVQVAFKIAAQKIGVLSTDVHPRFLIADDYEDSTLSDKHAEMLTNSGVQFEDLLYNDGDNEDPIWIIDEPLSLVHLIMRIAQTELDFEYEITSDLIPNFNGFWGNLNVSFGYGLFS